MNIQSQTVVPESVLNVVIIHFEAKSNFGHIMLRMANRSNSSMLSVVLRSHFSCPGKESSDSIWAQI
jgi:hypothetical protein